MIIATICCYLFAAILQGLGLACPHSQVRWVSIPFALVAICLHAILLHGAIDGSGGQTLNFFNLLSLTLWLMAIITIVVILFKSVELLAIFIFPAVTASIVLPLLFSHTVTTAIEYSPATLFHIILSVLTFGVLVVAGLISLLLWLQEIYLRIKPTSLFIHKLPPLQSVEKLLFLLISVGFILFTVLLASSLYFYYHLLWQQELLWIKVILVSLAWLILLVLLIGRIRFGWRGNQVVYYTLAAVLLLAASYFRM